MNINWHRSFLRCSQGVMCHAALRKTWGGITCSSYFPDTAFVCCFRRCISSTFFIYPFCKAWSLLEKKKKRFSQFSKCYILCENALCRIWWAFTEHWIQNCILRYKLGPALGLPFFKSYSKVLFSWRGEWLRDNIGDSELTPICHLCVPHHPAVLS